LSVLLDLSGVALKAKALSVATDCPRVFSTTKILSDVRPIFGDDPSKRPVGAVVLHNLRITYAENGEEQNFFVQLDTRDLKSLQENVNRALAKDSALRQFVQESRTQIFETSDKS
jgi:hypothetical protein